MPLIIRPTISQTFLNRVKTSAQQVGFQFKPTYQELGPVGYWKEVTFREFYTLARRISFGLMGVGVCPGDRVALLSNTRFEGSACDLAILGASAVSVPIYASNRAEDVVWVAQHSEARVLLVEDLKQLQKVIQKKEEDPDCLPHLEKIIVFEPQAMNLAARNTELLKNVMTLQALQELGRREEAKNPLRFDQNLQAAKPGDLVTLCYTSGTTGTPKGVMLTHENLMSVLEDTTQVLGVNRDLESEVILSFLPFAHIFGKVESLAVFVTGWRQVFAENLDRLPSHFQEIQPTVLLSVPRIFEKAYVKIQAQLEQMNPIQRRVFQKAFELGRRYFQMRSEKKNPGLRAFLEYQMAQKLLFQPILQVFGGRLKVALCGGAPLSVEIAEFFQILGLPILEGYGLTETAAPIAVNTPSHLKLGTVGRPFAEVLLRIAPDGEILIRSKKVFQGYFKSPQETEEVFREGWFHTGDLGYLDSDGFLKITDRKKDLIITSGGKNIAPQKIEKLAKAYPLLTQFVVQGDRRPYLTAVVTLDRDRVIRFAQENQILFSEYAELIKHPKVIAWVQKTMDEINRQLASFESIKKFVILPNELSIEGGELTPSLKIRRSGILSRYPSELQSLYRDSPGDALDSDEEIR
ncbi:MAG: AMP-dependent synthetase/ligase [Bdellovibrionia bacterium]